MKNIVTIIKGFFIGIANIIPGVSGGTLMITLGIYEEIIDAISHFFKNFKKNIKLVALIGAGALLSIVLMSRVITYSLENFKFPTIIFFVGLILGGIPMLYGKVKEKSKSGINYLCFALMFAFIMMLTFLDGGMATADFSSMNLGGYISLFLIGVVAAASMVIPGISGSFLLMFFGYYEPIMVVIKDFTGFNNIISNGLILGFFGIGVLLGIVGVAKLIEFLLNKFEVQTYYGILGFVFASVISILVTTFTEGVIITIPQIIVAVVLFVVGFIIAYKLGD